MRVAALVGDDGVVGAVRDEEGDLAGGVAVVAAVGVGVEGAGGDAEGGDAGAGVAGAGEAVGLGKMLDVSGCSGWAYSRSHRRWSYRSRRRACGRRRGLP